MNRSYGTTKCYKHETSQSRRLGSFCRDGIYSVQKSVNHPDHESRRFGTYYMFKINKQTAIPDDSR